ncbi:MAG TPA: glycoside hydrolase family 71/99-like protein [Acidobacteriota bacterium]|jgi:hypothetical protein|nr:glycoside hydrolase family 71/99-like protein [Acidobacteriota bacterium]
MYNSYRCFVALLTLGLFAFGSVQRSPVLRTRKTLPAFVDQALAVDPSTMNGKLLMGYQGWFGCPGDGSPQSGWFHWSRGAQTPNPASVTVDFWPDTSELDADELYPTGFTLADGTSARLYSAYNSKTVMRHFRWMKDYGLDGVFLQRFSSELGNARLVTFRNQVAQNVRAGAESYERVFAVMYDISGQNAATLVQALKNDWTYLVDTLKITESPNYLQHNGRPVLAIWGFGFTDRSATAAQAAELIAYFKSNAEPRYRVTLMGGVPTYWRTLTRDSKTDPGWASVYRSFDVISPWAVGRFSDDAGADRFKNDLIVPDLAEAKLNNAEYMPVVFPGFSWHNLNAGPFNQIPRNGGRFYWRQIYNAISAGCSMIYGAMFDEVDEGTAMYKLAPTPAQLPAQGSFVPLSIDGYQLPSDWYLRLAGDATMMLRGEIPLSAQMPQLPSSHRRRP